MKKKRGAVLGRLRLLALTVAAALALAAVPAFAVNAGATEPVVWDRTQKGSITVLKNTEDDFLSENPGLSQDEVAQYLQEHPDELTPLAGVVFRYIRVADVVQYTKDNVVKLGYTVDAVTAEFLGLTDADAAATVDGHLCYDASLLDAKLNEKTASETEQYMAANKAAAMPATDEKGSASVHDLSLGLYLLCEYTYPAEAVADADHCAPFFVSVPSTDWDADGSFCWRYDITVAPKNIVAPVHTDIVIVDPSGNETKEYDAEMADPTQFLIRSDIPNAIGKLAAYQVTAKLAEGITYDGASALVYGVTSAGERTLLVDDKDFTVSGTQDITFDFKTGSLTDTAGWAKYDSVEIYYKAVLNEKAIIGGEGNVTSAVTEYSRYANTDSDAMVTVSAHAPVQLFTYAIQIHKVDAETKAGMADVVFELQDEQGNGIPVTAGADGAYYLTAGGESAVKTDADGNIVIRGVEADSYFLKEVSTNALYNLLAQRVKVVITSNELDYREDASGTMFRADSAETYITDSYPRDNAFLLPVLYDTDKVVPNATIVCAGVQTLTTSAGKQPTMYSVTPLSWSCDYVMGSRTDAAEISGVVSIEVTNTRVPVSPKTGDNSYAVVAAMGLVIACGGVAILMRKKRNA